MSDQPKGLQQREPERDGHRGEKGGQHNDVGSQGGVALHVLGHDIAADGGGRAHHNEDGHHLTAPEAAQGGPIALIEENDLIEIDIPQRILRVVGINGEKCSEEEVQRVFNERRKALPPFKSRYTHGVLKRFTQTAHSPMQGGYMD